MADQNKKKSAPKDRANDPKRQIPYTYSYSMYKHLTEDPIRPGETDFKGKRIGEWDPEKY